MSVLCLSLSFSVLSSPSGVLILLWSVWMKIVASSLPAVSQVLVMLTSKRNWPRSEERRKSKFSSCFYSPSSHAHKYTCTIHYTKTQLITLTSWMNFILFGTGMYESILEIGANHPPIAVCMANVWKHRLHLIIGAGNWEGAWNGRKLKSYTTQLRFKSLCSFSRSNSILARCMQHEHW